MPSPTFFYTLLLPLAIAQSTTVLTVPFVGYDEDFPIEASLVSVGPSATTLALLCPSSSLDCGLFPLQTLTVGPSTYKMDMAVPEGPSVFTGYEDCSIGSAGALCTESFSGSEANFPGSSTSSYDATDVVSLKVTVTDGVAKLTASAASATPTASAAGSSAAKSSGLAKSSSSAATGASASNGSAASTAPVPPTATGAAALNAVALEGWFIGAAAVVGGLCL